MARGVHESLRRLRVLAGEPAALPALMIFSALAVFALHAGGYEPTTWYPAGILLSLLAAVVALSRAARHPGRRAAAALALLAAYTAWSFASIAWSDDRGIAWDGANRTAIYLVIFCVALLIPWTPLVAWVTVDIFCLAAVAGGVVGLIRAVDASDPGRFFLLGRYAFPIDYQNGACALFLMTLWPLLATASRRDAPVAARAIALAGATTAPELALLAQSRASLVATPIAACAYLIVSPHRTRAVAFMLVPILALIMVRHSLLDVFPAFRDNRGISDAVAAARNAVLISAGAGLVAGVIVAVLDGKLTSLRLRRGAKWAVSAVAIVALGASLAAAVYWARHPVSRAHHAWSAFTTTRPISTRSYFANGFGGGRYDIWRVAAHEIRRHPWFGVGVDNFELDHLRERRQLEEPLYPHSIELRIAAQTGIVGSALFLAFAVAAIASFGRISRLRGSRRLLIGASIASSVYWLVHGSVDWFWEIPALGGLAFALLGMSISLSASDDEPPRPRPGRALRWSLPVVAAGLIASMVFPWAAAVLVTRAAQTWGADPGLAFSRIDRARRLNPLGTDADLAGGAIASRLGREALMRRYFRQAIAREPRNWYAHLELAVAASHDRRWAAAGRQVAASRRLNPREPTIAYVGRKIAAREPVDSAALDRIFLDRIRR